MAGTRALRVCQIGKETTFGTSVAATAVLMGVTELSGRPVYSNTQRRWLAGNYAPAHASVQTDKRGKVALSGDFTFEDMPMILNSAIKGAVASSLTDTSAYTYVFPFPLTASPAIESRTWEISDGLQEYELAGGIVESFSLSGVATDDGVVQFSVNVIGTDMVKSTITGALSSRTVETLPASMCALYIDAIGGTVGTTVKADTLISWTLDYTTGVHLKKFQSGGISPTQFGYGVPGVKLSVTAEFNAAAIAELDAYAANTGRLVRIIGLGTTAGATMKRTLQIDVAGDITDISDLWGDRDGNTTVDLTITARLDSGAFAKYGQISIVNKVLTLPG